MKIECPHCKASGNMNEKEIPEEGMFLACPRCQKSFQIKRPRKKMTSAFATNTCPSCGYSTFCEEVFDDCPNCGVVVKELIEKKRRDAARTGQQDSIKMTLAAVPLPPPRPVNHKVSHGSRYSRNTDSPEEGPRLNLANFANGFEPVAAIGWGAVVIAAIFLVLGVMGVMDYHNTDIQAQLSEKSVEPVTAWEVFWGYGFLPWAEAVYGFTVLLAAFVFLRRESWGSKAMEAVIIISLVLGPLYELVSYIVWIVRSISPPWWAYLVEFSSALLFASIWAAPLIWLLGYIRGVNFRRSYSIKV